MNQVVLIFPRPVSAVPVFPATCMPGICAAVPVPPCTTSSIIRVSSSAVWRLIGRPRASGFRCVTVCPPGDKIRSISCGRISTPWLATAAVIIAICNGVTWSRSWPKASRPGSTCVAGFFGRNNTPWSYRPLATRSFSGVSKGGSEYKP